MLGANHPSLSTDLNNLAGVYAVQDRFAEAEPLYKRALALREQAQGGDHASVGLILASLAVLYAEHGDIAESRLLTAIDRADAPAAEIARKLITGLAARLATLEQRLTMDFPEYVQLARPKPLDLDECEHY